jgi:peptidoglycan-associated lipoprotein
MQLNKILKGLLIAVPVMTLAACSSSSDIDEGAANQANQANQNTAGHTVQNDTVEVSTLTPDQQAQEELRQKYESLRQEQIIYFDFDKATIEGKYAELLRAHAEFLVQNPSVKLLIEGHADERGTPEYNIALGENRGQSVEKYLQSLGVSASQMSVVSYGEEKPMVKSRTESAFAKNRRAVLVY